MDSLHLKPFSDLVTTDIWDLLYLFGGIDSTRPNFSGLEGTVHTLKLHELEQALEDYTTGMIWASMFSKLLPITMTWDLTIDLVGQLNGTLIDQTVEVPVIKSASELQVRVMSNAIPSAERSNKYVAYFSPGVIYPVLLSPSLMFP